MSRPVLLAPLGTAGDVHPFLGLGRELRARGHRVTMLTVAPFQGLAQAAELEFVPVGRPDLLGVWVDHPDAWTPGIASFRRVVQLALEAAEPLYCLLEERRHEAPLVISGAIAWGARLAQEHLGISQVTVHLSPAVFQSRSLPPVVPGLERFPAGWRGWLTQTLSGITADFLAGPGLNCLRERLGLPPVRHIFDRWWNSPTLILGLFPDWFGPPQPDWPANVVTVGFPRYDAADLEPVTAEAEAFLAAGSPPVVFTAGTGATHAEPFFRAAEAACRQLGRRGVLLSRQSQRESEGVRRFPYLPFSQVLPRCAALVHHGGIGTVSQALAAGIPQLVMPMAHDQHDNAERVRRLGAGRVVPFGQPEQIAGELKLLLEDAGVGAAARQCQARLEGENGLDRACAQLEPLLR